MRICITCSPANAVQVLSVKEHPTENIYCVSAAAPAARLTAYEAELHSGLGACAEEQAGMCSREPAPQDDARRARGAAPPCQPASIHSTQLASIY